MPNVLFLQINLLLKEYLSSGDKEEALRCLKELEVPHFHHELVYEAVVMVLEVDNVLCADMMCILLHYMAKVVVITPEHFKQASLVLLFVTYLHVVHKVVVLPVGFQTGVPGPYGHRFGCSKCIPDIV